MGAVVPPPVSMKTCRSSPSAAGSPPSSITSSVVIEVSPSRVIAGHHLDLVVEAQRCQVADRRLGNHHVDARVHHRLIPAELAPELAHRDVEVGQIVGVEDDALRIALVVADAEAVPEGFAHTLIS